MRNLYKRLGLPKIATKEQIAERLQSIRNYEFQKDINTVLLNDKNRKDYDAFHSLLMQIGHLRTRLGLNYSDKWRGVVADDFSPPKTDIDSKYEKFQKKIQVYIRKRQQFDPQEKSPLPLYLKPVLVIGTLIVFFAIIINSNKDVEYNNIPGTESYSNKDYENDYTEPIIEQNSNNASEPEPYPYPVLPFPKHGELKMQLIGERIAPFEIKSESGGYYLLKLQDVRNPNKYLTIFIHGGRRITLDIPLGSYILKYAYGKKWYGYGHYFGKETSFTKSDEIFEFSLENDQVSGYTITLYAVVGGNMETYHINPDEF